MFFLKHLNMHSGMYSTSITAICHQDPVKKRSLCCALEIPSEQWGSRVSTLLMNALTCNDLYHLTNSTSNGMMYLYRHEDLPPVNPRMIVLEPHVVESGHGRPAGATNIPTSQPAGRQDTSTRREPSAFERVLSQEEPRRRGRGRGRVQPYSRPNGQQTPQEKGIVGTMNLMVTLEVDDEVLAVAVLSELTNAASMMVYRVT
ncbi:hypothetical protein V8E54_009073 [Elaphomyces granulatus]